MGLAWSGWTWHNHRLCYLTVAGLWVPHIKFINKRTQVISPKVLWGMTVNSGFAYTLFWVIRTVVPYRTGHLAALYEMFLDSSHSQIKVVKSFLTFRSSSLLHSLFYVFLRIYWGFPHILTYHTAALSGFGCVLVWNRKNVYKQFSMQWNSLSIKSLTDLWHSLLIFKVKWNY